MARDKESARIAGRRSSRPEATHSPDGVDLTLIRWMLSMTPAQRLRTLQRVVKSVLRIRLESTRT